MDLTPEQEKYVTQYDDLCDLFERFGNGHYNPSPIDPEWPIHHTSPQARAFALRVMEILEIEDPMPALEDMYPPEVIARMEEYARRGAPGL